MPLLNRLRAALALVIKRAVTQPWLVVATTAGLVVAIGLMMSIPIYADGIYRRVFLRTMAEGAPMNEASGDDRIPPFTYLFRYDGSIYGPKEWQQVQAVDAYLSDEGARSLGLPLQYVVRYATTEPLGLFSDSTTTFGTTASPLVWASFAFVGGIEDHIVVTEGTFPAVAQAGASDFVDVMIHEDLAGTIGAQVSETFIAYVQTRSEEGNTRSVQIPVRVSGIWQARDASDPFWFLRMSAFSERLIVAEDSFTGVVGSQLQDEVYTAAWHIVMEGQDISHGDAALLMRRTQAVRQRAAGLLSDTVLGRSPMDALVTYRRSASLLTILLYAFSVPILGLLLAFIMLTSRLSVDRRRQEVAVLRSRGALALQMIGTATLESLLLGAVALAISSPVAATVARLIGQARSFMSFGNVGDRLQVSVTPDALRFGAIAVAVGVVAQVLPTFGSAGHTVVSYKLEQARLMRKPWWQRAWLDFFLFLPAAYGAYVLSNRGTLVELQGFLGDSTTQDPFMFLVPALGIFALTLFFLRFVPLLMAIVSWAAARTRSVGLLMAARHLARNPGSYAMPLILLILTLSLSTFTASLAFTLDGNLRDRTYYQAGADLRFQERGIVTQAESSAPESVLEGVGADTSEATATGPTWSFRPIVDYLSLPGITAAMRVGTYPAVAGVTAGRTEGVFKGIERTGFAQIAYWRDDFADQSMGALMNALALHRDGVLVPESFLEQNFLHVGDYIQVEVTTYGVSTLIDLAIVGTFEYFPTWYPSQGPLFVGDLNYLFEATGKQYPYDVALDLAPDADLAALVSEDMGLLPEDWRAPQLVIDAEQASPDRQGLLGLLSVGFAAAAVLTVLGFLLYALFTFRRRFIEFGVLRAVGLSTRQMTAFLGWELAFLILMGGGLGTLLGAGVSRLFIPVMQVGIDEASLIPPYVVDLAWPAILEIYVLFVGLFVVASVALTVMLRRMRISEAVKLGDTA